jgi:hypothetical protein
MGVGAVFILLVLIVVLAVIAALLLGVGSALRRGKMHPEGDRVESPQADAGERAAVPGEDAPGRRRPRHVRVRSEQRTRFIPNR